MLYESIGFLFSNWSALGVPLNQATTEFIWNTPDPASYYDLGSIPGAKVVQVEDVNANEMHKDNMFIWKQIVDRNKQFILLVSYEVSVRPEKR